MRLNLNIILKPLNVKSYLGMHFHQLQAISIRVRYGYAFMFPLERRKSLETLHSWNIPY